MTTAGAKRSLRRPPKVVEGVPLRFDSHRRSAMAKILAKIKAEAMRLGLNGTREGFKIAERLMKAIPELKNA